MNSSGTLTVSRHGRRALYGYTALGLQGTAMAGQILVQQVKNRLQGLEGVVLGHTAVLNDMLVHWSGE